MKTKLNKIGLFLCLIGGAMSFGAAPISLILPPAEWMVKMFGLGLLIGLAGLVSMAATVLVEDK